MSGENKLYIDKNEIEEKERPCKIGEDVYIIEYCGRVNSFIRPITVGGFMRSHSGEIWVLNKYGAAYSEYFITYEEANSHLQRLKK